MHPVKPIVIVSGVVIAGFFSSCSTERKSLPEKPSHQMTMAGDGTKVTAAVIDRFSDQAGHLQKRSANPSLPAADAAVDFDVGPFITDGISPSGDHVRYYNFDVQPSKAAAIYVFFMDGASTPLAGQQNLIDVIPGEDGYSDFWNVVKVTVPAEYVANRITSVADLRAAGYPLTMTNIVVNCPIVPAGSTAKQRYNGSTDFGLHQGWYRNMVVNYFNFSEKALTLTAAGAVPVSPIYVTFNKNPIPSDPSSGPASGFKSDPVTGRTHNVTETVPEDSDYSPLWNVNVYDNQDYATVHDLPSVVATKLLASAVAKVNCPIVAKMSADHM